jgi:hypothetical protein
MIGPITRYIEIKTNKTGITIGTYNRNSEIKHQDRAYNRTYQSKHQDRAYNRTNQSKHQDRNLQQNKPIKTSR